MLPALNGISNAQNELVEFALKAEIQKLNSEISHLKQLLTNPVGGATKIILTDMEVICMKQIANLKSLSMQRDLTLDEVKRLDLLNKNLRLAQSEPTTIEGEFKPLSKDITAEQLMQIASKRIEE